MKIFLLIAFIISSVSAQTNVEDAINSIFNNNSPNSTDFLDGYEEVTPPPLQSLGALPNCGEGDQQGKFVCVPYYNCDPTTKTVQERTVGSTDGSDLIDIRAGIEERKCNHYLDVCCQIPTTNGQVPPATTQRPVVTSSGGEVKPQAFCGRRNSQGLDFKVVSNSNEAGFGEFPWMVAILKKDYNPAVDKRLALCGGSLITPVTVLTGAHCVNQLGESNIKVRAGEWDTQTEKERIPYQERNVVRVISHDNFNPKNLYNDVALLILDRPFTKVDSVGTVCLPSFNQKFNSNECFATGWGKDKFGKDGYYSVILKKIQLPIVKNDNCEAALRSTRLGPTFTLHHSFICAGGEAGQDTCTGDGGSPLVCPDPHNPGRYMQAGIVAWGIGCGEHQIPGVYVDVAQFRSWIDSKLHQIQVNINPYIS